jgi:biotin carboxyl carrier protein
MYRLRLTFSVSQRPRKNLPPFDRITGIRFNGYNLSPLVLGTPSNIVPLAQAEELQHKGILEKSNYSNQPVKSIPFRLRNRTYFYRRSFRICIFADMYTASANQSKFEITPTEEGFTINNEAVDWNLVTVSDGYFHIIFKNQSYRAELVKADYATKTFTIKINGKVIPVSVKDRFDLLLEKMGMNGASANKAIVIKAPMPGLIIDLKVKQGDVVKAGDALLILEAMKMENIIKAPGEGTVKTIKAKKGDSVEKNQVLIEF